MTRERRKNKLGQYFTPRMICSLMLELAETGTSGRVLEPSSGAGAFLDELHERNYGNVTAVEIDPQLARHDVYQVANQSFFEFRTDKEFDLVIGNPPYIRWKDLAEEQKQELRSHWIFGSLVNSLSDYLLPFIALSVRLLRNGGELIFITPSFWLQTKHSDNLREFLRKEGEITDLIDFREARVFPNVATSLIVFRFKKGSSSGVTNLYRFVGSKLPKSEISLNSELFKHERITHFWTKGKFVPVFTSEIRAPLALEKACAREPDLLGYQSYRRVGDFVKIANGMVTGLDEAFRLSEQQVESLPDRELAGVSRVVKSANLDVIRPKSVSHYIDLPDGLSEPEVFEQFPSLMAILAEYRGRLQERYDYGDNQSWWRWSFYRSEDFHRMRESKGVVPGKERLSSRDRVRFALAPADNIATQDVTVFRPLASTRESIEYIVGFLSLREVSDWIRAFGLMKGGVAEFSEKPLSEVPFFSISWEREDHVALHEKVSNAVRSEFTDLATRIEEIEDLFRRFIQDS